MLLKGSSCCIVSTVTATATATTAAATAATALIGVIGVRRIRRRIKYKRETLAMAHQTSRVLVLCLLLAATPGIAFVSPDRNSQSFIPLSASIAPPDVSFVLSREQVKPILTLKEGTPNEKVVNAHGLLTLFMSLITGPIWMMAMMLVDTICNANEELDPNRAFFDGTGKMWSKIWLGLSNSYPTITGEVEALRAGHGPCLYVANHASWLDIPVLCTVLDPVFKFIAKSELENVPCIGQQLKGVSAQQFSLDYACKFDLVSRLLLFSLIHQPSHSN